MNKPKDDALRQVLQETPGYHLSPNFCFRTLQRVEEQARKQRKKAEQRLFWTTVSLAMLLVAGGVVCLRMACGEMWQTLREQVAESFQNIDLAPYGGLGVLVLILLVLDLGMRHAYHARQRRNLKRG